MPRPQDPNLYGQPPPKKQKKEMALSGSLAFTSQLSSLMATTTSSSSSSARPRPSKSKTDELLKSVKVKRKEPPSASEPITSKLNLKTPTTTEEEKEMLARSRAKMESKTRLYAAMKRGDYIGKEFGLVDFDKKWAESHAASSPHSSSSSSDSEDDDDASPGEKEKDALIEHTDSFGRTRLLTAKQIAALNRSTQSSVELQEMSARPFRPDSLIYGDAIQTSAFQATEEMQHLARKRDRSATPPPDVHYDANHEIRTKGVGFYKFTNDDAEKRRKEMDSIKEERERTEEIRRKREEEKEKRKRDIEKRRKEIESRRKEMGERRAEKIADEFLEGLGRDLVK